MFDSLENKIVKASLYVSDRPVLEAVVFAVFGGVLAMVFASLIQAGCR